MDLSICTTEDDFAAFPRETPDAADLRKDFNPRRQQVEPIDTPVH